MSFQRYETYKYSEAEWLDNVPDHWEIKRLGHLFLERRERVSDKDFNPLSVTKNGVVSQLDTAAKTDDGDNRKRVCSGDFVINGRSDRKGSSGIAYQNGSVSLINIVLQLRGLDERFVHHLLRSQSFQEEFYRYGKGMVADLWSTNFSEMKNILMAVPPHKEQSAIAFFLNQETSKIDALILKQQQLIELLKEKRQAVIAHAVTKGLNSDVPMRNSGEEWLGEIPEHWGLKKLKYACDIFPSNIDKKSDHLEAVVFLCNYTNVYYNDRITKEIDFMKATASEDQIAKFELKKGDVIVTKDSETADDIAIAAYVPNDLPGVVCGYHLFIIRPCYGNKGLYIKWLFDSHYLKSCVATLANGLARVGLSRSALNNLTIPLPPQSEQHTIAAYLDLQTTKLDGLSAQVCQAITLLQERRIALISAAVTGKIDIRNLVK